MKGKYFSYPFTITILCLLFLISCKDDELEINLPEITTTAVIDITETTAISGGTIISDGGAAVTARGVCWSENENPTTADFKTTDGKGTGSFSSQMEGMSSGTAFFVRAYATNAKGTAYGNSISIATLPELVAPTLTTTAATEITQTTAMSGGAITSDGGAAVTARGVCWSSNENPTTADFKTIDGEGTGSFSSQLEGMSPGTTFFLRAYATNAIGTAYGNSISIATLPELVAPTLTTTAISQIGYIAASSGGETLSDGGSAITSKGICWSTTQNPTIADSKTTDGTGTGNYTSALTGLTPNTKYYVRAYATNTVGTGYGSDVSFTTLEGVVDGDDNLYTTVTIGTQVWLKENLKTTKYTNGDIIGTTDPDNFDLGNDADVNAKYQWPVNRDESTESVYGRLYTWHAITDSRGVCPAGWHVPTFTEMDAMTNELGGNSIAGDKLKEAGTTHWASPNAGTNETGFSALPAGFRQANGYFDVLGYRNILWTQSANGETTAYIFKLYESDGSFTLGYENKKSAYTVRCLKD
ncbi:MAG: hypothetical protein KF860_07080 [Cyclobacteriaceae bacterium]|nr:hypothetical protein [Cyclobacteriaceae bacterium]